MVSLPFAVIIVTVTWVLSAGITYGVLKTKIDSIEERVARLEDSYIPRPEYQASREDVVSRLKRIEGKIDNLK